MDDDFNSPEACAVLFEMIREVNRLRESDLQAAAGLAAQLKQLASVLGVLQLEPEAFLQAGAAGKVDAADVDALIAAREVLLRGLPDQAIYGNVPEVGLPKGFTYAGKRSAT